VVGIRDPEKKSSRIPDPDPWGKNAPDPQHCLKRTKGEKKRMRIKRDSIGSTGNTITGDHVMLSKC
jgi:hypothetical protein